MNVVVPLLFASQRLLDAMYWTFHVCDYQTDYSLALCDTFEFYVVLCSTEKFRSSTLKYVRSRTLYSVVFVIIKKGSRAESNGKWKSIAKCSTSCNQFLYSHFSSGFPEEGL